MSIKTSVIGFPRIGKNRELKFASEKFFKGEISEAELPKVAAEIRQYGWQKQKAAGIDFIPSNDFSFYDNVLDTAFLLNVIPERYSSLELSTLEKYFAAAHGYQGAKGDVKALPMKKWFNTNYHYIVPEINDATDLKLVGKKPVEEFNEAKSAGIESVRLSAHTHSSVLHVTMVKRRLKTSLPLPLTLTQNSPKSSPQQAPSGFRSQNRLLSST